MIRRFTYIVLLLAFMPVSSFALAKENDHVFKKHMLHLPALYAILPDTTSKSAKHQPDDKNKIKEIGKAKRQPKPEKIDEPANGQKAKPKRQRRPEGLERPPEIPRRSGGG